MNKVVAVAGLAMGVLLAGTPAAAQGMLPLAAEVKGGFAFPTGDFGEGEEVGSGVGFGATAMFQVMPMIGIYAGWDRYAFGVEEDPEFPDVEADLVDSGFSFGAQLNIPVMLTGVSPWVQGGGVYRKLELDIDDDTGTGFDFESDSAFGFEVGAGVGIPLGMVLSFNPAVRYRSYAPEFDGESGDNVSYFAVELGMKFGF